MKHSYRPATFNVVFHSDSVQRTLTFRNFKLIIANGQVEQELDHRGHSTAYSDQLIIEAERALDEEVRLLPQAEIKGTLRFLQENDFSHEGEETARIEYTDELGNSHCLKIEGWQ